MNFVSKLFVSKIGYEPACIAGLNRFTPINKVGIYGVINVSLANYIGDCEVLNELIDDHKRDIYLDHDNEQLISDIDEFFKIDGDRNVHEYLLTTLSFEEMLSACAYLATQYLITCDIKPGSSPALMAVQDVENSSSKDMKTAVEMEMLAQTNEKFDHALFYQSLVMREQLEILLAYVARFKSYRAKVVLDTKVDYEPADDELELTTRMAYKSVGLREPICIPKIIQMTNIFASDMRILFHDIVVYLLDNLSKEIIKQEKEEGSNNG